MPFSVPGLPGLGTPGAVKPADVTPPADAQRHRTAPPAAGSHRKPPERRTLFSGKGRMAAALVVVAGALGLGFTDGFGDSGSPETTVQTFLLDWQDGHYAEAAALTNAGPGPVKAQLAVAYTDLNATNAFFTMTGVRQHGNTAVAT
ncbi:MAG: hypothetical protein ACRDOI_37830, partial [Trebonia sp.]